MFVPQLEISILERNKKKKNKKKIRKKKPICLKMLFAVSDFLRGRKKGTMRGH